MAVALLVGTNAWATDQTVTGQSFEALNAAITATGGTGTVTLNANITENVTTSSWVGTWIGTAAYDGDAQDITLDLNGHSITITADADNITVYPFVITKGKLKVVNNATTLAKIDLAVQKTSKGQSSNVFWVFGSYDYTINPKGDNPFTLLEIGQNVQVTTTNGTVIAVDAKTTTNAKATSYHAMYFTDRGMAFGARVDVKGTLISQGGTKCYGIKTNGNLGYPGDTKRTVNTADWITADYKANIGSAAAIANAPYVHVWKGAVINSDPTIEKSAAVYCSGYAQWLIEGTCDGNIGVSVSSGNIDINDATISSSADTHVAPNGSGSVSGSGSAIVVNSRDAYAGAVDVNISGDTEVSAQAGYAIEEVVNTTTNPETGEKETKVQDIEITGGTFQGGTDPATHEQQPAVIISSTTAGEAEVVVYGGNVAGELVVDGDQTKSLDDFVPQDAHTTTVVVDGKEVTVISEGEAPKGQATIAGHGGQSVKWTGASETINADIELTELEINQATAQVLTVATGRKLTIGRAVLGPKAQIIVEAGASLIINGEQGFVANEASNFILKTQEGNPAIFLFHPSVTSNRHPKATVEFISKGYGVSATDFFNQRFGIPTNGQLDTVYAKAPTAPYAEVPTLFAVYNYTSDTWENIGYIHTAGKPALDYTKLANPFDYYQMQHNAPNPGTIVTMEGALMGNESPALNILGNSWQGFANSYMAPIDGEKLINMIPNSVQKAIYMYDITADHATWEPYTLMDIADQGGILPMQPFLIRNTKDAAEVTVDFAKAVYYPTTGEVDPNPAPARLGAKLNNITRANIIVKGENSMDILKVAESDMFSAEFDNGYEAEKYMNDGINMYVNAEEKMAVFATDNLEGTYVSFEAMNGGNYTIEFAKVQGEDLTLIDHATGASVLMVEGNTYEFTAEGVNDYRFEIVKTAPKMPTAIENAEAAKSAKGIYTITGQYMGEMNVWNSLPAGVYVVNGEKLVK